MTRPPVQRSPIVAPLSGVLGTGLPWESGGGGVAVSPPVNTVAPVISSDGSVIGIGEVLTTTNGTWTGTPSPTFTYQWQRGATFGTGGGSWADIGGATASTRVVAAADIGYSLRCVVTGTNAAGSSAGNSNALLYLHATDLPNTAIGICAGVDVAGAAASGLTLADSDTTVQTWTGQYGGKAANVVLDAPAAGNRPPFSATGGPGGRNMVGRFVPGSSHVLRDAAITAWGFGPAAGHFMVIGNTNGAETLGDILMRYTGTTTHSLAVNGTPLPRVTTPIGSTNGTTNLDTTHRQIEADWITGVSGSRGVLVNNAYESSTPVADTSVAQTDAGALSLGAAVAGTAGVALACIGWAVTFKDTAATALSASQRANLRAFFQNGCGVA